VICESAIVAEYLDRKYAKSPEARLLSDDPKERARAQLFVEMYCGKLYGFFYKLLWAAPADRAEISKNFLALLRQFNDALAAESATGPFAFGDRFTWPDAMISPWFSRFAAIKVHRGFEIPETEDFARLRQWVAACKAHPSVAVNARDDDYYAKGYASYAAKGDAAGTA
jgi:glutathione S-transferase